MSKLQLWLDEEKKLIAVLEDHDVEPPAGIRNNYKQAIAVIEALKAALEFYKMGTTAYDALAIDPDSLLRNSNKEEKL